MVRTLANVADVACGDAAARPRAAAGEVREWLARDEHHGPPRAAAGEVHEWLARDEHHGPF
jgi:hypothetical protein